MGCVMVNKNFFLMFRSITLGRATTCCAQLLGNTRIAYLRLQIYTFKNSRQNFTVIFLYLY